MLPRARASGRSVLESWRGPRHGHVIAFTEDGKIVADLQDPSGVVAETTGLTETRDCLYVQTIDGLPGVP